MTHVTMEIDIKRLLSVRDTLIGMIATHDNVQAAIDKACLEVRRFMTAELHAKYQAIFNLFYAPVAERTVFPPDHGTFHPYYTPAYMRLCGLIGSLVYALPIRVGIPWIHYRRGNPAIPPNVYDNDNNNVSCMFYSTEDRILYQVTSPNVRWAVFPPGIGARYILAKCMFVTQTPARPFVVITNTSHQMEWVRILATVCGWTVENGSVFLFGLCTPEPVTFTGSELKAVVINCHDFHHVESSICNGTLCVGLTIVDGSTIDDEPWFRPPMTRDLMGQIYPSPLLILSPPLRIPSMTILDCGPIARSIVTNSHSHVELPMIEFSRSVHCVDVFNGHACFTPLFEAEIRAWIQQRRRPPPIIITSEVGFRSTSKYMSPRYMDKVIHMTSGWRSETQLSRTAKRIAQAMCFIPHGDFDDMFYDAVLIPTFHKTCQPMCASREIERWECSVCYCSFAECAKPWDALVTQCCSTEVCARCYFQATRVHRKCIICGPAHHITMPFVPAICVYKTPEPPTTLIPPIPEIEFRPNEQLVRTIFDVDYPRVLLQALRKYVEAFPEVTILMTPTPFHLRVERSCLSPYMVEFKEKTFREFTNTARIIMWDPDLTPIQALPRLTNITDIVIGDAARASRHVDNLIRLCSGSREKLCVRYIHWATLW